jgi:hypothetical protein
MRTLLRSTFVAAPDDNRDLLLRNVNSLEESGLGFDVDEDEALWTYIKGFVNQYHHPPDVSTLRSHFTFAGETAVVDRLEAVSSGKAKSQGDFLTTLNEKIEERRTRKVTDILRDAARILDSGIEIKEGKQEKLLRGPVAAVRYVMEQAPDIVAPTGGQRLSGNVTADGIPFAEEYERTETNPLAGIGQMSGIRQMDDALRGAKRGELWTHAAFTGGLKSTLMLNWCYSQAVYYRHSSIIFSLEMPYVQVRRILYAMHSAHHKFDGIRQALGVGKSLSYSRIRDGELDMLSPEQVARLDPEAVAGLVQTNSGRYLNPSRPEKTFLMDYVIPDFNDPVNEYGNIHIEVADPDKSDFTVTDLRNRSEVIYSRDPTVSLVFADHAGLMAPRHHHSSTTERLNEVLRDLKRFSMSFNRGAGIGTVALFQISREGYKSAEKNGGRYNLTHLSYANEAERSSDIVTAGWVDDNLRQQSLLKLQCLKSRDDQPFEDFYAGVLWPCRRIFSTNAVSVEQSRKVGEDVDKMLAG